MVLNRVILIPINFFCYITFAADFLTAMMIIATFLLIYYCVGFAEGDDIHQRGFNFGPGPAALPVDVLERAAKSLLNFRETGIGIMEYTNLDATSGTHPGEAVTPLQQMMVDTEEKLRAAIDIPADYDVLLMHAGAVGHFSAIPMNFLGGEGACGDYLEQGFWSRKAFVEAQKYGDVQFISSFSGEERGPQWTEWAKTARPCAAYFAVVLSETVQGVEILQDPPADWTGPPVVVDATSTLLSRPIDVSAYGMIYASGGKNLPAGVSVVIVRRALLDATSKMPITPAVMDYRAHAGALRPRGSPFESRPNTPAVWGVYLLGEVLDHLAAQGGVVAQAVEQENRAGLLYRAIDASNGFYNCSIHPSARSQMNVVFNLPTVALDQKFLEEAEALPQPLPFLWGHSSRGGVRVTTYNWVTNQAIQHTHAFMTFFALKHSGSDATKMTPAPREDL